jgi:hypothetical protein
MIGGSAPILGVEIRPIKARIGAEMNIFRARDDHDWRSQITRAEGLSLHQWLVRESIRCKQWADYYWHTLDSDNEATDTQRLIERYNEVCDWLDLLEEDAVTQYRQMFD